MGPITIKMLHNNPALLSYCKMYKKYKFDLNLSIDLLTDPSNDYWTSQSLDHYQTQETYYNLFIKKYFIKKQISWNTEKESHLLNLLDTNSSWLNIAIELGIHPYKCIKKSYEIIEKNKLKNKNNFWTKEEDIQLKYLIDTNGIGKWSDISNYIVGKTANQCLHRYKQCFESVKKGKWSKEEDDKLIEAVELIKNKKWTKIAKLVPGRSDLQCRDRYIRRLNTDKKTGTWNKDEDKELLYLIGMHGEKWALVSKQIKGRTDSQCRRRWLVLTKTTKEKCKSAKNK